MMLDYPNPRDIPGLRQLWKEAFGDSDLFLNLFFQNFFHPNRCRCITDHDHIVAALYWFDCSFSDRKIAYLYAVATAQSHRGQGLCRKLMADTHELLKSQGYAGAILVPGEESLFRFYGAMGYETIACSETTHCPAGDTPTPVTALSPDAYAALRQSLLPANAVLQEGDNLRFLAKICALYGGDDWVMAATVEGESLFATEFLGNIAAAPGILAALHLAEGSFRTPGSDAFAMYLRLDGGEKPAYFGLAFD